MAAIFDDNPDLSLPNAVLATVAYADMFDFPLDRAEIWRDLIGRAMSGTAIEAMARQLLASRRLATDGRYLTLPGRHGLAALRAERAARARRLWPVAQQWGALFARLPFVRMVALTGSLTAGNPDAQADIDYLIVTAPGRLWTTRALAILVVRLARRAGVSLCPNYLLSTRALALARHDLFTAHELLQAEPLAGATTYRELLARNRWSAGLLPNRYRQRQAQARGMPDDRGQRRWRDAALAGRLGDHLEAWEFERKRRRFSRPHSEARFTADVCEGHFGASGRRALAMFARRCRELDIALPAWEDEGESRERRALRPVLLPAL